MFETLRAIIACRYGVGTPGWHHGGTGDEQHVWPCRDVIVHEGEDCECRPQVVPLERPDGSIGWLVKHRALDGRPDHEVVLA